MPTTTAERAPRVDGSMSLLVDMMTNTLDSSYAEAAGRRQARPSPDADRGIAGRVRRRAVVPVVLVLGLLTGTAAAQVRNRQQDDDGARAGLNAEVARRTAQTDDLTRQVEALRAQVAADQSAALGTGTAGRAAAEQLAALELAAGTVPVRGQGLVVELDDAPAAKAQELQARGGAPGSGRVLDRDLQDVVNGLWAAGAEAVSVNDLRLTALTAIRSAGEAVLVDFRPLSPPYVVRAVGSSSALSTAWRRGAAGQRLATYPSLYGIAVDVRTADDLRLPAAGVPDLTAVAGA